MMPHLGLIKYQTRSSEENVSKDKSDTESWFKSQEQDRENNWDLCRISGKIIGIYAEYLGKLLWSVQNIWENKCDLCRIFEKIIGICAEYLGWK